MTNLLSQTRNDIIKCEEVIQSKDIQEAQKMVGLLAAAYNNHIPEIKAHLTCYSTARYKGQEDYISDLEKYFRG